MSFFAYSSSPFLAFSGTFAIDGLRRYTAIEELTYENVHEFIDRILIHELDKETNTRKIEIFYSFVGRVDTGDKPTESISYFRQIGADVKSYAI